MADKVGKVTDSYLRLTLRAKFTQNAQLKRMLVETNDAELIHESSNDHFWGRSTDGTGENRLGQLLMELRTELG